MSMMDMSAMGCGAMDMSAAGSGALEASFRGNMITNRRADALPRLNPCVEYLGYGDF